MLPLLPLAGLTVDDGILLGTINKLIPHARGIGFVAGLGILTLGLLFDHAYVRLSEMGDEQTGSRSVYLTPAVKPRPSGRGRR